MAKGFIWMLLGGGIIGLVVLAIVLIISWYLTTSFPIICNAFGNMFENFNVGGLCWWVQFLATVIILKMILPIGK